MTRGSNKYINDCKGKLKHAEIIDEIRRAFIYGQSKCKNTHIGSGGSNENEATPNNKSQTKNKAALD